jgi:hypothetical protein
MLGRVDPDVRDAVVDFIRGWAEKTGLAIEQLLDWLGLSAGKFYQWRQRYGKTNQHNGGVPRDFWLQDREKPAILDFQELYPSEGYRRLTYMMIDNDVVAVSPSSVFRVCWARLGGCDAGLQGEQERHGFRAAFGAARALAHRYRTIFTALSTTCARCWMAPAGTW